MKSSKSMNDKNKYMKIKDVVKYLNVSPSTLRRWDREGVLHCVHTPGKHRRWLVDDIKKFAGEEAREKNNDEIRVVTYARCSSTEQKTRGDIDRQSERILNYSIKKGYRVVDAIKDCGSGLNDMRKGFRKLLSLVVSGKVDRVVIENKDRLTRFGYETLVFMFHHHHVDIELVQIQPKTEYDELTADLMMLIASFSGKLYRKRQLEREKQTKD